MRDARVRLIGMAAIVAVVLALAGWHNGRALAQSVVGPGLGDDGRSPAGTPVRLALPAGYALEAIRGGFTEDYVDFCVSSDDPAASPVCSAARGGYEVTLVLRFDPAAYVRAQDSNRSSCTDAPRWGGWVLTSDTGEAQNILVPGLACAAEGGATPILDLPPPPASALAARGPATVEFTLGGYCLNLSRHVPDDEQPFSTGVITNDPGLLRILAAIEPKNLYLEDSQDVIQDVVWNYTDGDGLTPDELQRLAELP